MLEATNVYANRRMPARRDTFSTINSLAEDANIIQQYTNLNKSLPQRPIFMENFSANVRFQNSESIHVGNIVYHIHHHPKKSDNKDSDSIRSDSFGSLNSEPVQNFEDSPSNLGKNKKFWRIIAAIVSVSLIFASASAASYFALLNKKGSKCPEQLTAIKLPYWYDANKVILWQCATRVFNRKFDVIIPNIVLAPDISETTESSTVTTEYTTTTTSFTKTETESGTTPIDITTTSTESVYTTTESYFKIFDYEYGIDRNDWGALPPKSSNIPKLELPIKRIIVGHTDGNFCSNEDDCVEIVKSLQFESLDLDDIPYNFLIGGDAKIYEGRGFNYQGQHTQNLDATEYNSIGICIAFIGNYTSTAPSFEQFDLLRDFIETFVENGLIANNHIIILQDDLKYFPTKANSLNNVIKNLQNFRPLHKIYRREEWGAQGYRGVQIPFNSTMNWLLIGHSETPTCNDLTACKARARSLQDFGFDRSFDDILYNIFFGGDGLAFEGRGWDNTGALHNGLNSETIGVGAIGNYTSTPPNPGIIGAMLQVFDDAMALGKLTDDYKVFGRSDFGGPGPGVPFMNIIKSWCRYGNGTKICSS